MRIQAPRGTEDLLPSQSHKWQHLEREFFALTRLYGYREIRTPMFEDIELFKRTSGETSDIVSKEMYDFYDKGERHICLRPEGTAPVMRAAIEHGLLNQGTTLRMSYAIPFFRYGRPQKGRLRQAHQFGLEVIGSPSPAADAEIIEIVASYYERIRIGKVQVMINSIGRAECRAKYREVVLNHFGAYLLDLGEDERDKAQKNPLRLLDSKDPKAAELKASVPPIVNYLEDEAKVNFETLQSLLTEADINFRLAPDIVRGLDYYTDTVFEVVSDRLGAQSSLCGGGRYDGLIRELGGPPTPSVGVGMGIERAILVLESLEVQFPEAKAIVYVVQATDDAGLACRTLARTLRNQGLETHLDLDGKKMAAQLKQADRVGARFAAIIGTDELASNAVTFRELETSSQETIPINQLGQRVKERL
ncbi:MAG: histidine--tRNA ligase [Chlorobia bacterium]|nr:histidine--tRNA ligase [Fimbriimonadaceae bacterium]